MLRAYNRAPGTLPSRRRGKRNHGMLSLVLWVLSPAGVRRPVEIRPGEGTSQGTQVYPHMLAVLFLGDVGGASVQPLPEGDWYL